MERFTPPSFRLAVHIATSTKRRERQPVELSHALVAPIAKGPGNPGFDALIYLPPKKLRGDLSLAA